MLRYYREQPVKRFVREVVGKIRRGNKCELCGNQKGLTIHHKIKLSRGGTSEPSNLQTLCNECHVALHQEEAREGS